jgi:hypothetical protein
MDGLLEAANWHGKVFEGPDQVHRLVHNGKHGDKFCVNPGLFPFGLTVGLPFRDRIIPALLRLFLQTKRHKARLRVMDFKGMDQRFFFKLVRES